MMKIQAQSLAKFLALLPLFMLISNAHAAATVATDPLPKVIPTGFYTDNDVGGNSFDIEAASGGFEYQWFSVVDFPTPIRIDANGKFSFPVTYVKENDPCQTNQAVNCVGYQTTISGIYSQTASSTLVSLTFLGKLYQLSAARAPAIQTFTGESVTVGSVPLNCGVLVPPTNADAQADADKQASDYCATLLLQSERVSDFSFSTNYCVWGGAEYHYPSDTLTAEAQYQCK